MTTNTKRNLAGFAGGLLIGMTNIGVIALTQICGKKLGFPKIGIAVSFILAVPLGLFGAQITDKIDNAIVMRDYEKLTFKED